MTSASGATHVGNRRLRVLPGGMPLAIESLVSRRAAARHAMTLFHAGIGVLTVAFLALIVVLATYEFERARGLALPLTGLGAGLVGLGTALVTRALAWVRRLDPRSALKTQR